MSSLARPMIVDLWSANTKLAPNRLEEIGAQAALRYTTFPPSRLRGNFTSCRPQSTDATQCPPSHIFRVARDSGKIRLLRALAGIAISPLSRDRDDHRWSPLAQIRTSAY